MRTTTLTLGYTRIIACLFNDGFNYLWPQNPECENEREYKLVLLKQTSAYILIDTLGKVRVQSRKSFVEVVALRRVYDRLVVEVNKPRKNNSSYTLNKKNLENNKRNCITE